MAKESSDLLPLWENNRNRNRTVLGLDVPCNADQASKIRCVSVMLQFVGKFDQEESASIANLRGLKCPWAGFCFCPCHSIATTYKTGDKNCICIKRRRLEGPPCWRLTGTSKNGRRNMQQIPSDVGARSGLQGKCTRPAATVLTSACILGTNQLHFRL